MAGSIVATSSDIGGGITKYSIAWTSSAGGAVSANTLDIKRGRILQAKFVPGAGGSVPTDLYDVTLADADGADLLLGLGGDRSATLAQAVPALSGQGSASEMLRWFEGGTVTPTIANAGNAKTGTLILYVGP
jgi:hypothetical protein